MRREVWLSWLLLGCAAAASLTLPVGCGSTVVEGGPRTGLGQAAGAPSALLSVSVPISALTYRLSYRLKLGEGCAPYNNLRTWIDQLTFPGGGSSEGDFLIRAETRGYTPEMTETNNFSSFSANGQRQLKFGEWMGFVQQYFDGVHVLKVDDVTEMSFHSGWGHTATHVVLAIGPRAPNGWNADCTMLFDDILLEAL